MVVRYSSITMFKDRRKKKKTIITSECVCGYDAHEDAHAHEQRWWLYPLTLARVHSAQFKHTMITYVWYYTYEDRLCISGQHVKSTLAYYSVKKKLIKQSKWLHGRASRPSGRCGCSRSSIVMFTKSKLNYFFHENQSMHMIESVHMESL